MSIENKIYMGLLALFIFWSGVMLGENKQIKRLHSDMIVTMDTVGKV